MIELKALKPIKPEPKHNIQSLSVSSISRVDECHKPIQEAVLEAFRLFENIESQFVRETIKKWITTDLNLLKSESLIEKQYQIALSGDQKALQNVVSGMEYWLELVNLKIKRCLEESGVSK